MPPCLGFPIREWTRDALASLALGMPFRPVPAVPDPGAPCQTTHRHTASLSPHPLRSAPPVRHHSAHVRPRRVRGRRAGNPRPTPARSPTSRPAPTWAIPPAPGRCARTGATNSVSPCGCSRRPLRAESAGKEPCHRTSSANSKRARACGSRVAANRRRTRGGYGGCARFEFNPKRERSTACAHALREVRRSKFGRLARIMKEPPRSAGRTPAARRGLADGRARSARAVPPSPGSRRRDARTARARSPPAPAVRAASPARP